MARVVIDDHVLRDVLSGNRTVDLDRLATDGLVTTGLWLYRLCWSFANPGVALKLSAPVLALSRESQADFRAQLTALPAEIEVLPLRELAWLMAELQRHCGLRPRHRPNPPSGLRDRRHRVPRPLAAGR